ncbi:MAG TPA: bifunctional oligoribonuclease/PAP phosphatase NrnA [Vicinamibacterales bacterium]|nr:bifunctional oligoribonuclease/PAP phosphatase NrnA [Vicinamibacterales bacterium]
MAARIAAELRARQRFVITSHLKPDGDSIGSQMAMAGALRALGKDVRVVNCDQAPQPLLAFPWVDQIEITDRVEGDYDAAIVMECGDLARTGVQGLERFFLINIDHHPGNAMFGAINWFDASAAACGEMVFEVIRALDVPISPEIGTHIYLAILTDTGSFHYSSISPRTFDICRQALEAGVDPVSVARNVFDSNNIGRLRLFGAVLGSVEIEDGGRLATIYLDHAMARAAGGTYDDTEGLINLPLTVKEVQAVAFFKEVSHSQYRVSLRSKGGIDVGDVAKRFGGGGHKNASGCTVDGTLPEVRAQVIPLVAEAIGRTERRGENGDDARRTA